MTMIDFTVTNDPEAKRVYDLMMEALRVLTPAELAARVVPGVLAVPGLTDAQKLAMRWTAERYANQAHGSGSVNGLLQMVLYGSWTEQLAAPEAGSLTPEQRIGVVLGIGEAARQVVAERAAQLGELSAGNVAPFDPGLA